jgi:hypothetical protein
MALALTLAISNESKYLRRRVVAQIFVERVFVKRERCRTALSLTCTFRFS